ncbi:MAG TPA: glycine cleavage T C-terminal barrel domain-containing protein [Pyrinomonadaceae bacterium]|jgi:folate-binding protein YgfZ
MVGRHSLPGIQLDAGRKGEAFPHRAAAEPRTEAYKRNMSEAVEQRSIPANYGDTGAEYAAVREGGAGLIDLSSRGRILVSGTEAVPFLNGLITNDVKALEVGAWMPAAFPNVQGRLLAAIRVLNRGEDYLIDTEAITHAKVLQLVGRFTLAGDFRVTDVTKEIAIVSIQGRGAGAAIRATLGEAATSVERHRIVHTQLPNVGDVTVIRASHTAEDGFDLFVSADHASSLWQGLLTAGARPVGLDVWEILRIESGLPRYGVDMDDTTIVSETTLDDAVSFTKGCYIGQEIIARIKYRGHVAKKLAGLVFDGEVKLKVGAKIRSAEKEIGRITSFVLSPALKRTVALGYVKYDFLAAGTSVKVVSTNEEIGAQVTELPFVRGSWYPE